jgi:hypothetical protein
MSQQISLLPGSFSTSHAALEENNSFLSEILPSSYKEGFFFLMDRLI